MVGRTYNRKKTRAASNMNMGEEPSGGLPPSTEIGRERGNDDREALVINFFYNPAFPIVADLNVPLYFYVPSGASVVSVFLYLPTIHNQTDKSLRELGNTNLDIPGLPPIHAAQMPDILIDRNNEIYNELLDMSFNFTNSRGIISNTFQALEPRAIETVEEQTSRGVFPGKQIAKIAEGLERSGQRFFWVVRSPPPMHDSGKWMSLSATDDFDLDAVMPKGFLDRTRDRGLVGKSWAP
ncbi:UDP-glycosyltransferase 88B1-like [Macadamia integrifolia]|uniref:UDP-glycosyltransferase 88B1-like n=1 Tax=Macadamia integrifolia TaxID=60698 RepID=UPI001C4E5A0A|nr:UDP-glycosyltransferase 88B1-like [Macadamia integrifolia]